MGRPGKAVNWEFLDGGWSPPFAWFLGMTMGDGNVHAEKNNNSFRVSLSGNSDELDIVEKWRKLICPTAVIHQMTKKGIEAYFYSKDTVEWFARRWGLCGDKMECLRFPEVPRPYLNHFARGLVDSDGSIFIEDRAKYGARGNKCLRVKFYSSVPGFTSSVAKAIALSGFTEPHAGEERKTDKKSGKVYKSWGLRWSGLPALRIADWLYKDSSPENRGDTGFKVYQEYLGLRKDIDRSCACGNRPVLAASGMCRACLWSQKYKVA